MSETSEQAAKFGAAAVYLLRGILYRDRTHEWEQLLRHRRGLEDYFTTLSLQLFVDEAEGYAYLRQTEAGEAEDFPRLMSRRNLSYPQTILLVLLRKRLVEFEASGEDSRLVLSGQEMLDMMRVYWGDLDAHGLQIVNQLRSHFPHLQTFLMDRQTLDLLAEYHTEATPTKVMELPHLTPVELALYDYLSDSRIRLEQERVPLRMVRAALR